jgi:WhiB family transcriptional regulator, redox-sensing transcriptional regulator
MTVDRTQPRRSAVPTAGSRRWQRYPCQTVDPDLWFAETPAGVEEAKRLCRECPIRLSCLATALRRVEAWGVWGGELVADGQIRPYKRARGRPRKQSAGA